MLDFVREFGQRPGIRAEDLDGNLGTDAGQKMIEPVGDRLAKVVPDAEFGHARANIRLHFLPTPAILLITPAMNDWNGAQSGEESPGPRLTTFGQTNVEFRGM